MYSLPSFSIPKAGLIHNIHTTGCTPKIINVPASPKGAYVLYARHGSLCGCVLCWGEGNCTSSWADKHPIVCLILRLVGSSRSVHHFRIQAGGLPRTLSPALPLLNPFLILHGDVGLPKLSGTQSCTSQLL